MNPPTPKPGDPAAWLDYDSVLPDNILSISAQCSKERPQLLWHYTTRTGLMGILDSQALWLTDLRFLNDTEEFHYAISVAEQLVNAMYQDGNSVIKAALRVTVGQFKHPENYGGFVFSLSEVEDSLSLWRAYCHDGGYAIGFECECPDRSAAPIIRKCVYEKDAQEKLIGDVLVKYRKLSEHAERHPEQRENHICRIHSQLGGELAIVAPMIKHRSFHEEHEWRIIVPMRRSESPIQTRVSRSAIVPFIELPFTTLGIRVSKIMIGPTKRTAGESLLLQQILNDKGYLDVSVCCSESPYRDW